MCIQDFYIVTFMLEKQERWVGRAYRQLARKGILEYFHLYLYKTRVLAACETALIGLAYSRRLMQYFDIKISTMSSNEQLH